ncbi:MAG: MaoC family dehydratase N-terminal domain-containing protein [Deltaproteobacteria bacterium]|nr:MaoC family dehydratase N-terminal domain-containing protein [Deltaproteobacteria bacterium]MBI3388689.1 MaoC family dehydratase N-terminal domain-containing protein [Deltaproteobacteria bacterium]
MGERTRLYFDDVKEGDEVPAFVVKNLTRTDLVRYAGASGDFNPIHHDQTFAEGANLPGVFAHGMLNAGFVGKCVTDYVGVQNLRQFKVRFATRVWPGDTITCKGTVTKKYDADGSHLIEGNVQAINQKGEVAIHGSFKAALPIR